MDQNKNPSVIYNSLPHQQTAVMCHLFCKSVAEKWIKQNSVPTLVMSTFSCKYDHWLKKIATVPLFLSLKFVFLHDKAFVGLNSGMDNMEMEKNKSFVPLLSFVGH